MLILRPFDRPSDSVAEPKHLLRRPNCYRVLRQPWNLSGSHLCPGRYNKVVVFDFTIGGGDSSFRWVDTLDLRVHELDRLLARVDQLSILKTRATFTLAQQAGALDG